LGSARSVEITAASGLILRDAGVFLSPDHCRHPMMRLLMLIIKRLTIWAGEVISQAILLGLLLIGFYGYDQHAFGKSLLTYSVLIVIMFFMTGYVTTTAILRAVWRWRKPWLYSVIATALFLIHFEVMNIAAGGAFEIQDRLRIRITGACIAFFSTLSGTAVLQKWTVSGNSTPVQPDYS
jgi:hypothetical protein